jgi:4a-hydroxytetrahydrobiopterin dehydratase
MSTHNDLATKHCGPCTADTPPLAGEELERLLAQLSGWSVVAGSGGGKSGRGGEAGAAGTTGAAGARRLEKQYRFPDFRQALAFVNRVGELAEQEGHHPDIELGWGRVKLTLWTHSIGGLSENDFILAAKADRALAG